MRRLDSELKEDLARAHARRGTCLTAADRNAESIREFRSALDIWHAVRPAGTRAVEILTDQLRAQNNLGVALMAAREFVGAEAAFHEEIELAQPLVVQLPDHSEYQSAVGRGLANRAVIAIRRGDLAGARELLERAIPYQRAALKAAPNTMEYRIFLSDSRENLALVRMQLGDRVGGRERSTRSDRPRRGDRRRFPKRATIPPGSSPEPLQPRHGPQRGRPSPRGGA